MLYGAVQFGGNVYRVKTAVKRVADQNTTDKAHAYSVEKIEVLVGQGLVHDADATNPSTSTPARILLRDVCKVKDSNEPGALQ